MEARDIISLLSPLSLHKHIQTQLHTLNILFERLHHAASLALGTLLPLPRPELIATQGAEGEGGAKVAVLTGHAVPAVGRGHVELVGLHVGEDEAAGGLGGKASKGVVALPATDELVLQRQRTGPRVLASLDIVVPYATYMG